MTKSSDKQELQLGMPHGMATSRLRKMLLFRFVQQNKQDICHHCCQKISSLEEFSVEHVVPWLDSQDPAQLFFDLNNITYSHRSCNTGAARRPNRKYFTAQERLEANRRLKRESRVRVKAKKENIS
jgi:hypothetical protein